MKEPPEKEGGDIAMKCHLLKIYALKNGSIDIVSREKEEDEAPARRRPESQAEQNACKHDEADSRARRHGDVSPTNGAQQPKARHVGQQPDERNEHGRHGADNRDSPHAHFMFHLQPSTSLAILPPKPGETAPFIITLGRQLQTSREGPGFDVGKFHRAEMEFHA